jgi:hypothetical protein
MADITVTTTQVVPTDDRTMIFSSKCGEAITIGQVVYKKAADNKLWKAISTTAATAAAVGIAISSSVAADQDVSYQKGGTITLGAGASITAGAVYVVTDTAGGISLEVDRGTGDYMTILGVANASNGLVMPTKGPFAAGLAHA